MSHAAFILNFIIQVCMSFIIQMSYSSCRITSHILLSSYVVLLRVPSKGDYSNIYFSFVIFQFYDSKNCKLTKQDYIQTTSARIFPNFHFHNKLHLLYIVYYICKVKNLLTKFNENENFGNFWMLWHVILFSSYLHISTINLIYWLSTQWQICTGLYIASAVCRVYDHFAWLCTRPITSIALI